MPTHPPTQPAPASTRRPPITATLLLLLLLLLLLAGAPPQPAAAAPAADADPQRTTCSLTVNPTTFRIACTGPGPVTVNASSPLLAPLRIVPTGNVTLFTTPQPTPPEACGTLAPPEAALIVLCSQAADLLLIDSTIAYINSIPYAASPQAPLGVPTAAPSAPGVPTAPPIAIPEGLLGAGAVLALLLNAAPAAAASTLTISNLTVRNVTGGTPLFIAMAPGTSLRLADSTFLGNAAPSSSGGALALQLQPGQPDAAPGQPAAAPRTAATLTNVSFIGNVAFSGGGFSLQPNALRAVSTAGVQTAPVADRVLVDGCVFEGNRAVFGGGLYAFDCNLVVQASMLRNNTATWYGGGAGMESMQAFVLNSSQIVGNRAGHYGGGMFGAGGVGNAFNTMTAIGCNISENLSEMQGGGIFLQRGSTVLADTAITNNVALQQGGGIAFLNLCGGTIASTILPATPTPATVATTTDTPLPADAPTPDDTTASSCGLQLTGTTRVLGNSALSAGGGLYVAIPGSWGINLNQVNALVPAAGNSAPYSPGVSALPAAAPGTGIRVNSRSFRASSSTGPAGVIQLVADVYQHPPSVLAATSTQLAVQFCDNQYLDVSPSAVVAAPSDPSLPKRGPPFLLRNFNQTQTAADDPRLGRVNFTDSQLRLLSGVAGQSYCLRVHAPDYPDLPAQTIAVTITACQPGEVSWPAGCLPCGNLTYSFRPNDTTCLVCDPNAICEGGAVLVPKRSFWHSAPNSSDVQPCPNRRACQGDRHRMLTCQAAGNCSTDRAQYQALQCSGGGYTGNLCGSCNTSAGYGQALYFQCAACMPRALSVLVLLVLGGFACGLVVFVAKKSQAEADDSAASAAGSVVLVMDGYGGSWKAAPAHGPAAARQRGLGDGAGRSPRRNVSSGLAGSGLQLPSLPAAVNREVAEMVRKLELSDVFKVLLLHLQYLTIVGNLLVDWPRPLRVVLGLPRLLFFSGSSEIVSWECLGLGNGAMMALSIVLPFLVVLVACGVTTGLHRPPAAWLSARLSRGMGSRVTEEPDRRSSSGSRSGKDSSGGGMGTGGTTGGSTDGGGGAAGAPLAAGAGRGTPPAPAAAGRPPEPEGANALGDASPLRVSWHDPEPADPAAGASRRRDDTAAESDTPGPQHHDRQPTPIIDSRDPSGCSAADSVIVTVIVGVSVFYFMLVSTSMSAFSCIRVDGQPYWIRDLDVACWTPDHLQAAMAVGVPGVLIVCLLLPVAVLWWLARNRRQLDHVRFKRRYGFLYRLYRPKYCFWEGVVCLQTIVLVCITLFARGSSTYFQLVLLSGVLVLNYTLVSVLRPFRCRPLQWLYVASTVILLATSLGAQLVWHGNTYMREVTAASGVIAAIVMLAILVANVVYVVVCLYIMGRTAAKLAQKTLVTAATWVAHATRRNQALSKLRRLPLHNREGGCADLPPPPPPPLVWPKLGADDHEKLVGVGDPGSTSSRRHAARSQGLDEWEVPFGHTMHLVVESSGGARWQVYDQQHVLRTLGGSG